MKEETDNIIKICVQWIFLKLRDMEIPKLKKFH